MREFSRTSMGMTQFNEMVDEVYNIDEGQVFRKREHLSAFRFATVPSSLAAIWMVLMPLLR